MLLLRSGGHGRKQGPSANILAEPPLATPRPEHSKLHLGCTFSQGTTTDAENALCTGPVTLPERAGPGRGKILWYRRYTERQVSQRRIAAITHQVLLPLASVCQCSCLLPPCGETSKGRVATTLRPWLATVREANRPRNTIAIVVRDRTNGKTALRNTN